MTEVTITVPDCEEKNSLLYNIRYYLRIIFHVVAVLLFWSVFSYGGYVWYMLITDQLELDDPNVATIKWFTPCFLTNWNFMFQTCFLSMSLVYDLMEWLDRHDTRLGRTLKYYRDVLFSGIVVPLTLFISSMFWTLYWIDRELVFPQIYDQLVPWWFNHCVHTNILIVLGLETLLQARRHPTNLKLELWLNGIIGVCYAIVYYSIFFFSHRWLYGVFGIMTWWQVCLYQLVIWASTFIFYAIQFPINRIFHKEETPEKEEKKFEIIQNGEKKPEPNGFSSDSWKLKFRAKSQIENSSL